ncbi:PAS domain-containing sensor histidine kinase [Parvularcula lutaonensis]|uniref:histidine kinase n=1 Tax=Parvularcula lutaonensis TaxID=491923 RepID=A0ABV7MGV7_9PROT|nr:PAS domain-containing sensor histidine kinase [Parvularcula lutaonensis]
MILEQDIRGTIVEASESSGKLFGGRPERLLGLRLTDLVAARAHPELLNAMNRALREGQADIAVDLRREARAPHAILTIKSLPQGGFRTRIRPLLSRAANDAGKPGSDSVEPTPDKLADVSHEIRTPLNAVIGFADALRQESFGPLGDKRYRDYAKLIQESGQHVLSLVNDLLDMSKAEAGKLDVERRPVRVDELVVSCAQMMRLEAERAGLTLSCKTASSVGIHSVDPKVVRQILLNLLSNALKFTKTGGIVIRTRLLDGALVIAVEDTGVGMSGDDLQRIGERFYQARPEGVRGTRGSGLGLALSSALAKAHGGCLDLTSEPGRGTVATLTLPLSEAPAARPRRYRPIEAPASAELAQLDQPA